MWFIQGAWFRPLKYLHTDTEVRVGMRMWRLLPYKYTAKILQHMVLWVLLLPLYLSWISRELVTDILLSDFLNTQNQDSQTGSTKTVQRKLYNSNTTSNITSTKLCYKVTRCAWPPATWIGVITQIRANTTTLTSSCSTTIEKTEV